MITQPRTFPLATIPQPPMKPLLGNLPDIDATTPTQGMMRLAREYGPIFRLELPGRKVVLVSGYDLVDELCDEKRFDKKVWKPLQKVRTFAGDGLFTAKTQEANWHKAHNILLPNFSQRAMQGYFPMMLDIAEQMMTKWERLNADDEIDARRYDALNPGYHRPLWLRLPLQLVLSPGYAPLCAEHGARPRRIDGEFAPPAHPG